MGWPCELGLLPGRALASGSGQRGDQPHSYKRPQNFPGGPVVKKSVRQCRGLRFDPWSGKIPHAVGQLKSMPTTTEP